MSRASLERIARAMARASGLPFRWEHTAWNAGRLWLWREDRAARPAGPRWLVWLENSEGYSGFAIGEGLTLAAACGAAAVYARNHPEVRP